MITRSKRRRLELGGGVVQEWYEQPSEEPPEHNARVKRIKARLNAHRVGYLKFQLHMLGLPQTGRKRELVDRLTPNKVTLLGSPLDRLPDELVLKILKLAACSGRQMWNYWGEYPVAYNYDFIIYNLCMVSARFNRITRDPSFWENCDQLRPDVGILGRVTKWFLHAGMTDIRISGDYWVTLGSKSAYDWPGDPTITGDHIAAIATKCPNLKRFEAGKVNIETWPAICMPALEELKMLGPGCGAGMFRNMQLHLVLPRLEVFLVRLKHYQRMWVPDLTKSFQLREVYLQGGTFHVQPYLEGTVPFPRTLEKLTCMALSLDLTNHQIEEHFEDSDCELWLKSA